jgi:hypothetical protein
VFGGWNSVSFGICSLLGLGGLLFMKIISKRTIHKLSLHKDGKFVEITYFNAFWVSILRINHLQTPHNQTIHTSEFTAFEPSYLGYSKVELTSIGKVWINLDKNVFTNPYYQDDVLLTILNGHPVKLDALRFEKKYKAPKN